MLMLKSQLIAKIGRYNKYSTEQLNTYKTHYIMAST